MVDSCENCLQKHYYSTNKSKQIRGSVRFTIRSEISGTNIFVIRVVNLCGLVIEMRSLRLYLLLSLWDHPDGGHF
jgi:hypothetical protein